jgi:hypothetical protein
MIVMPFACVVMEEYSEEDENDREASQEGEC